MGAAVEARDDLGIGETVEAQSARHRDHMPTIDQPLAILAQCGVEMHLGGVLPQPRGQHMLGLLNGDAIDMVNLLANLVIPPAVRLACEGEIIVGEIQAFGDHQIIRVNHRGQIGGYGFRRGRMRIAFAHHDPADIVQHHFAVLIAAHGADPDNAGFAA